MKYVQWVAAVLGAAIEASEGTDQARVMGASIQELLDNLGFEGVSAYSDGPEREALGDALRDLERIGLIEMKGGEFARATQEGRKAKVVPVESSWDSILEIYLDDSQMRFLTAAVSLCEVNRSTFAGIREVTAADVTESMGEADLEPGAVYDTVMRLTEAGCLWSTAYLGTRIDLYPTYVGVVRATEAEQAADQPLIRQLAAEWETTTVEFKRELDLRHAATKSEFVRDVLGLATTKASGTRYMIIGFDEDTRAFHSSVDVALTQDRIESILHAYTEPTPDVTYRTARWESGSVGILRCTRDPAKIPYKVKKRIGRLQVGDVFVRHGTHVEPPTPAERKSLEEEGAMSRGERRG